MECNTGTNSIKAVKFLLPFAGSEKETTRMVLTRQTSRITSLQDSCGRKWEILPSTVVLSDHDMRSVQKIVEQQRGEHVFNPDNKRMQYKVSPSDPICVKVLEALSVATRQRVVRDAVIISSLAGCAPQQWHCDYDPDMVRRAALKPLGALVALDSRGANLRIMTEEGASVIYLKRGQVLLFDGDLVHAGGNYDEDNLRLHMYLDSTEVARQKNKTYLIQNVPRRPGRTRDRRIRLGSMQ